MTAYMMVYLVSPFIEAGLQALDKKTMLISFVGMTAIEILSLPSGANWGSTFFGLLYIYVIARYMRILNIELNARKGIAIYILALLSMILLEEFINGTMHKKERLFFMLDYNNPLIITQAVCIFYIVKAIPQYNSNFINRFFAPCLCIYLIQEVIFPYKAIVDIYSQSILKGIAITAIFIISSLLAGQIIFYTARKLTDFIARIAPALITKCGSHPDEAD